MWPSFLCGKLMDIQHIHQIPWSEGGHLKSYNQSWAQKAMKSGRESVTEP